ncbi:DUF3891 family protein [Kroppenstedtia pulmonis]|uniref:DUF3891 family protein n=1 Tax=Kroppenstedtia pulmonis TaxID=1380685 RepID=A0A7D3XQR7_9BACL|nr:DUF3891 family protein [Kroppenstedtia pulmonis]QKG83688.1 DUF3891 family protein [Kroppenstedtia pulmonis]
MIVRETDTGILLIRQHDHGLIAGKFASHWREKPEPWCSIEQAIRYHDVGWVELDRTIRWNSEQNKPYSFMDHPLQEKLPAYRKGIDQVETHDAFAAFLCSRHYTSFFEGMDEPQAEGFLQNEKKRQERLLREMGEAARSQVDDGQRLLKLCDDLSLYVCFNPPGYHDHPWFREGFRYGEQILMPVWEGPDQLRIHPNPFEKSFSVCVPYQTIRYRDDQVKQGSFRVCLET